ncbi:hypothetical protein [Zunongwangia sp.]|uniref:hypothetical protein n=1 Tax=Zunongwangia sp. TaxID=1965325 RepID=UPI003AA87ABB
MEVQNTFNPGTNQISPKKWCLYIFVSGLPIIGLILLLVWAFSDDNNPNRKNWAQGMLLVYLIGIVLSFFFFILFGAAIFSSLNMSY